MLKKTKALALAATATFALGVSAATAIAGDLTRSGAFGNQIDTANTQSWGGRCDGCQTIATRRKFQYYDSELDHCERKDKKVAFHGAILFALLTNTTAFGG